MVRRVVTGHGTQGQPIIASDGEPPRTWKFTHTPQFANALVWATQVPPRDGPDTTQQRASYLPEVGETVVMTTTLPPASVYSDPGYDSAAAAVEAVEASPGLADTFEPDNPGFHRTPSVDYVVVLKGEIVLDLGDGESATLHAGDVVVQNATRHAWRNETDEPATFLAVMVGAALND